MNLLKLSFSLLLIFTLAACGDDDSAPACTQSDWVGTYMGTQDCDGNTEDVTVTITASGSDAIIVEYQSLNGDAEFDPLTPNGCNLDRTESAGGNTLTVDANLDGNNLNFIDIIALGTTTATCTITATRQ